MQLKRTIVVHDETHPCGETTPTSQGVYRVKVVTVFLMHAEQEFL